MTAKSIAEQINAIREATQKAAASPETALDFLRRAGIADTSSFAVKKNAGIRAVQPVMAPFPPKQNNVRF